MKQKLLILIVALLLLLLHTHSQNVGIGTANPTANFHSVGSVRFQGIPTITSPSDSFVLVTDTSGAIKKIGRTAFLGIFSSTPSMPQQSVEKPDMLPSGLNGFGGSNIIIPLMTYRDSSEYQILSLTSNQPLIVVAPPSANITTRDPSLDWSGALYISAQYSRHVVILGNYFYITMYNSNTGEKRVYRYQKDNISAGGVLMTFTGLSLGNSLMGGQQMTSDGVYFYFPYNAGNSSNDYIIAKYSISGTTFTYQGSITCGNTNGNFRSFFVNKNFIYGFSGNDQKFRKFNMSGSLIATTIQFNGFSGFLLNWEGTLYNCKDPASYYEKFFLE